MRQSLNRAQTPLAVRCSNKAGPLAPDPRLLRKRILVAEADETTGYDPLLGCRVTLQSLEVPVLAQRSSSGWTQWRHASSPLVDDIVAGAQAPSHDRGHALTLVFWNRPSLRACRVRR